MSFQALCNMFLHDVCRVEDFSALYMIRRTEGGHFFDVRNGSDRLIVNLADSDHEWRDTVIRIMGLETIQQKYRQTIQTAWSKGTLAHKEAPVTAEVEQRVQSLFRIEVNYHNWSSLLIPSRPPFLLQFQGLEKRQLLLQ